MAAARTTALLLAAVAVALWGCTDEGPATADRPTRADQGSAVQTELQYEPAAIFEPDVEEPAGIYIDRRDRLYVAGREGVRVYGLDGRPLLYCATSAPAVAVAVDEEEGEIYVALETAIEVFSPGGDRIRQWGAPVEEGGRFGIITNLTVHGAGVYVADPGRRLVHQFALDGDFVKDIGGRDLSRGIVGLVCPSPFLDVRVDEQGRLHVTNPGRHRVEVYDWRGEVLSHWGEFGREPHQFVGCCNPTDLLLMEEAKIAVSEKDIPRVKVYDADRGLLAYIGPEHFSRDAEGLDLAADSAGRLYVLDPPAGVIHIFEQRGKDDGNG